MKSYIFLFALIAILSSVPAISSATTVTVNENGNARSVMNNPEPSIPVGNAYVPKDTRVKVIVPAQISSRLCRVNDTIVFRLKEDFIVNNAVIAPKGTSVFGTVVEAKEAWGWGHGGELGIKMIGFGTYRNVLIPLENSLHYKGESYQDMATIVYGILPALLIWGDNAIIPAGTEYIMRVPRDIDLGITVGELKNLGVYSGIAWDKRETEVSLTNSVNPPTYN